MTDNDAALGPPRTKDKVLIVGGAHSTTHLHPPLHLAADYEVWSFNQLGNTYSRDTWDRYFELHTYEQFSEHTDPPGRQALLAEIAEAGAVVYLAEEMAGVQPWHEFPFLELCSRGPRGTYHCSSWDWLVQLAFELGFSEIRFAGLGSLSLEAKEPRSSRACLEYWLGVCEGEGVRIALNDGAHVLYNVERDGGMYPMDAPATQYAWDHEVREVYSTIHNLAHNLAQDAMQDYVKGDRQAVQQLLEAMTQEQVLAPDPEAWGQPTQEADDGQA